MTWPIVHLDDAQKTKFNKWLSERPPANEGASGGRYVYTACPTNLGLVLKVRDEITSHEIDLTDYDSW